MQASEKRSPSFLHTRTRRSSLKDFTLDSSVNSRGGWGDYGQRCPESCQHGSPRTRFEMPRVYKRKTEKKYTLETLKIAIREIQEKNLSSRKAAEKYNVPTATLLDQVRKSAEDVIDPKRGKKPIFNESQEQELIQFILKSCRNYFGITPITLRKVAFDFATANGLAHNFNKATGIAGIEWPDAIYNVDETGISTVQRNSKILAPKGLKQVDKCTSAERGSLTTVVNCASGNYVPPFFIFKTKRMNPLLMKQSNSNMIASISDSGWINEELFVQWLHHFKSFTSADNVILLVLDNHESHISLAAYNFCKKNFIHVITLPPHTSHKMQPLDLTFHGPLKTAYNRECETHMVNNPGAKITSYDIIGLYTKAFNRTTNIEKAINGFRAAGICPLDKEIFRTTFDNLMHSDMEPQSGSNIRSSALNLNDSCTHNEPEVPNLNEQTNASTTKAQRPNNSEAQPRITNQVEIQSVAHANIDDSINDTSHPDVSTEQHGNPPPSVPLQDIVNIPTIKRLSKKTNRKKKHSIIVTDTPEKIELEKKELKKVEKRIKQEAGVRKGKKTTTKQKKATKPKKKSQRGVRNLRNFEDNADDTEYFCIFCNEKYYSPPTEDWVMCRVCQNWAHENCTSGSSSRGYICDLCKEK
ncbi:hypothetical protein evm_015111 [Chilo suppressalis]|nr:hypothetical protein evm_015111 [Chilo suppressalis]